MKKFKIWCSEFSEHDRKEIELTEDLKIKNPHTGGFVNFQKSCESCKLIPMV